jgi:hypothetical protein
VGVREAADLMGGLVQEREAAIDNLDRQVGERHERAVEVVHPERFHRHRPERDRLVDRHDQAVMAGALEDRVDNSPEKAMKRRRRVIQGHTRCRPSAREETKTAYWQAVPKWRDPDSNRGHHDFQSCGHNSRTGSTSLQIR